MSTYNYIYHSKVNFREGFSHQPTKSNDGDPGIDSELEKRKHIKLWGFRRSKILISTIFMGITYLCVYVFREYKLTVFVYTSTQTWVRCYYFILNMWILKFVLTERMIFKFFLVQIVKSSFAFQNVFFPFKFQLTVKSLNILFRWHYYSRTVSTK